MQEYSASFMSPQATLTVFDGNPDAKIVLVGDCPDKWALDAHKPFAHAQETVLLSCLHQAGLIRHDVLIVNLINDSAQLAVYWRAKGAKGPSQLKSSITVYKAKLYDLLLAVKPKVVVTVGELATYAVLNRSNVTKIRGYPFQTEGLGLIVIPTLHPRDMIWSNYEWRHYLSHDLMKAKKLLERPELLTNPRTIALPASFDHACELLRSMNRQSRLSIDIEVSNFEISCIGFAPDMHLAVSIPFDMRWSEAEEVVLWNLATKILENQSIIKIFQNGIFDIQFLAMRMGIFVKPIDGEHIQDSMVSHHIMFPDFLKSLNFLGSIHTFHSYWKDELEDKPIKKEN